MEHLNKEIKKKNLRKKHLEEDKKVMRKHLDVDRYKNVFHSYFDKLNKGKQFIWVMGNHDEKLHQRIPEIEMVDKFQFVKGDKIYYVQHYDYGEVHDLMPDVIDPNVVFVHGHTHADTKLSRFDYNDQSYIQNCVCWDAWYRPVNANELEVCG